MGCLRPTIIAPANAYLVWADYSQIEARVLCWLAGTEQALDKLSWFANPDIDVYEETAARILNKRVSEVTKFERQIYGKVPELALGYGGAVGTFNSMSLNYGVSVPLDTAKRVVQQWRAENKWALDFWARLSRAVNRALSTPESVQTCGRIAYIYQAGVRVLWCCLPDERVICYRDIAFDENGELTSLWASSYPKNGEKKWPRARLWPGLLTENVTQATAASIMRYALRKLNREGHCIVGHTHDEVLLEEHKDLIHIGYDRYAAEVRWEMTNLPPWAEGLPLDVEIEYGERYKIKKDTPALRGDAIGVPFCG